MIYKCMLFSALFLTQAAISTPFTQLLGSETCLSADKITHSPGSLWQISADSSEWEIVQNRYNSTLTQFTTETPVYRTVEPYHNLFTRKLAMVTCHYDSDTLVLRRTYKEGVSPFPDANYIAADTNVDSKGNFTSFFFNSATSCLTTMGALDKCPWLFLQGIGSDDIAAGFYGGNSRWL